jgi:hypothetical protein
MTDADYEGYSFEKGGTSKNPSYLLRDANGNVLRTYTQAQYAHLQRRGHGNATLDRLDSAAFFRSRGGQTASEKAAAIRQEEQNFRAGESQKTREFQAAEGEKDRVARAEQGQQQRDFQAEQSRLAREARQKEVEGERKWKEEQTRQEEMRRLQNTSWEEQGFDAEQRMELSELHRKRNSIAKDPNLRDNQTERDAALKDIDDQIAKIKPINPPKSKQDAFNDSIVTDTTTGIRYRQDGRGNWIPMETTQPKPMSPQEIYESSFVDENGNRWINDGKGGIRQIANTSDATPDEARRKYIFDRIKELTAENAEVRFTIPDAIKKAGEEYDAVVGSQSPSTPTPTNGGAQPPPAKPLSADEAKKKWALPRLDDDKQF